MAPGAAGGVIARGTNGMARGAGGITGDGCMSGVDIGVPAGPAAARDPRHSRRWTRHSRDRRGRRRRDGRRRDGRRDGRRRDRCRAPGSVATAAGGPNSSTIEPAATTVVTPPQTEQRALPATGIFVGSTRENAERHSGHETFTYRPPSQPQFHASASPALLRRTAHRCAVDREDRPRQRLGVTLHFHCQRIAWAACVKNRRSFVTTPIDTVINGTRCSWPRRSLASGAAICSRPTESATCRRSRRFQRKHPARRPWGSRK